MQLCLMMKVFLDNFRFTGHSEGKVRGNKTNNLHKDLLHEWMTEKQQADCTV